MAVLTEAFGGTGQPLPGQGSVAIWYMEQGFQTTVDPAKAALYHGVETDRQALPAWVGAHDRRRRPTARAPDQATQLTDALQRRLLPARRSPRSSTSSSPTRPTSAAGSPGCSGPT